MFILVYAIGIFMETYFNLCRKIGNYFWVNGPYPCPASRIEHVILRTGDCNSPTDYF